MTTHRTAITRVDYALAGLLGVATLLVAGFMAPRGFQQGFVGAPKAAVGSHARLTELDWIRP